MRIATKTSQYPHPSFLSNRREAIRIAAVLATLISLLAACASQDPPQTLPDRFDGHEALTLVHKQLALGPRIPGSEASRATADWIHRVATDRGWQTSFQVFDYRGVTLRNVVAMSPTGAGAPILLAAHYDTRPLADRDATTPHLPVPGANDGASGTAVLLELARILDRDSLRVPVWLAFFDAEDSGGIDDWDWIVGSQHFTSTMAVAPKAVVIVDMVGDADLQLFFERSSDPILAASIWSVADDLHFEAFIPEPGRAILDDHVPFLQLGIPAVDIIDVDYPHWHTTEDTADKISPASLEQVGRTLQEWLAQTQDPEYPFP